MKKRRILIVATCVVVIGVILGIVLAGRARREVVPQQTAVVTRSDIIKTVLVDGNLVMPNKAYLSFGVTGTVKEVLVAEGNNVTKGQVLARLDASSLESSVKVAELQVKIAEEQVKQARAQYQIASINLQNAPTPSQEKVFREQLNIAEASWSAARLNLEIAKLNLESAKLNLEKAIIVAPFDGVIADVSITKGQQISTATLATPAISLVDTSKIEMSGFIDELDIATVKVGQEASILLDSLPDTEIKGKVTFISPIGTNRAGIVSYATTIALESPSAELRDGMTATAKVVIERRDDVLIIPNKAIKVTSGKFMVKVLVDGQIEEREITVGLTDGTNTEVLSGLEEGEKVILPVSAERSYTFFDLTND